jgi:glycosyltransferase involved in cell wall biosynthesis
MKILIYAQHFPPGRGGMEFSNFEIAKGLNKRGHLIEVVTIRNRGAGEFVKKVNFPVTLMPKWPPLKSYSLADQSRANWIFQPVYARMMRERIDLFQPDVILIADEAANCFWGSWPQLAQVPYMSYCSVPFIAVNGTKGNRGVLSDIKFFFERNIEEKFKGFIEKSYTSAKWISVVSQSTRNEILKLLPQLEKRMDVIPRSIDDSFFWEKRDEKSVASIKNNLRITKSNFTLLSVSNIEAGKGVDDVLQALAKMDPSLRNVITYIVIGDGGALLQLKVQAKNLGLADRVIFMGSISHNQLIPYYDACDLYILPSRRGKEESFGRVFAEAAARSKPSIGVAEGGMIDVIINGKTGFLVNSGHVDGIQDRIQWCLINKEAVDKLGYQAKQHAELRFKSNNIARLLEKRLEFVSRQPN